MKALIIIAACIVLALIFKVAESLTSGKIRSVGAKSNANSKNIAKIDINDEKSLAEAMKYYKDMID